MLNGVCTTSVWCLNVRDLLVWVYSVRIWAWLMAACVLVVWANIDCYVLDGFWLVVLLEFAVLGGGWFRRIGV